MYCPHCKINKDPSEFSKNRASETGYQGFCKKCMYQIQQKYKPKGLIDKIKGVYGGRLSDIEANQIIRWLKWKEKNFVFVKLIQ
ncbi:MAG TPA: hypothetical protein DHV62_09630 [Elusimicrobia bacterium]|nr:hypothetical protein [Elusimicrobiota bacterium]